jgi:subtilisin family serine protease
MIRHLVLAIALLALQATVVAAAPGLPLPTSSYVVILQDGTDAATTVSDLERRHGFTPTHRYASALLGFAARLTPVQRAAIAREAVVASIHDDRRVRAAAVRAAPARAESASGVRRVGGGAKAATVAVAVIDTGVDAHPDLNMRSGANCVGSASRRSDATTDDNGHGTHVAGTIGGKNGTGVAPGTLIYAVKVLDATGGGTSSSVICGIDWVTANASRLGIRVASMSLGMSGGSDTNCGRTNADPLHRAICHSVASGVVYVVAAGNDGADLAGSIPAAYPEVLSVSAMADTDGAPGGRGAAASCAGPRDRDDTAASFSNFARRTTEAGHLVAAPGVCIRSTWVHGRYNTISGTSMATPHVSAAVALCISSGHCHGTAADIARQLRADAQAHATAANGFAGDPRHQSGGRVYGDLVWAGGY